MKCQILFSGKNITNLSSAELTQRVVTRATHNILKYFSNYFSNKIWLDILRESYADDAYVKHLQIIHMK